MSILPGYKLYSPSVSLPSSFSLAPYISRHSTWYSSLRFLFLLKILLHVATITRGSTITWQHHHVAAPSRGNNNTWQHYHVAAPSRGSTITWQHHHVAAPSRGSTITWQNYHAAVPSRGSTITWQHYHDSLSHSPHFLRLSIASENTDKILFHYLNSLMFVNCTILCLLSRIVTRR